MHVLKLYKNHIVTRVAFCILKLAFKIIAKEK